MAQATHEQANLLLHLYELRREPRMRQARAWFSSQFDASTPQELNSKYPMGSEESASLRMVLSYWEMASGLVNRGLIEDEMYFENSMEAWVTWEKVKTLAPLQRDATKNPTYLAQLEKWVTRFEQWRERVAPGSLEAFRQARASARRPTARSAN